jgi:hypothetical protein
MYKKGESFYADWRSDDGKRHRKAFVTRKDALKFEAEQRAKKVLGQGQSRPSSHHSPIAAVPDTQTKQPAAKHSSRSPVARRPRNLSRSM